MALKNTFSTTLFTRKGKIYKEGEARIFIRITAKGERREFSTGISVKPEHWESGKGRIKNGVKDASAKNQSLENLIHKVHKCRRDLIEENLSPTAENIINRYNGTDQEDKSLLVIFDEHNKKCEELSGKDFAPATIQKYKSCRKIVADFVKYKYKKQDMPINSVDHKFVSELEHYFKTVRGCSHNTTLKYIQNFRKVVLIGINNGWLKKDPFANISYKKEKKTPVHFDEAELSRIINKKFTNERLDRICDVFVFCCFTGLAYCDAKSLQKEEIIIDSKGKQWIEKDRTKTGVHSLIPLLNIPKAILKKLESDPWCISNGKLLPIKSNQKMNEFLKK